VKWIGILFSPQQISTSDDKPNEVIMQIGQLSASSTVAPTGTVVPERTSAEREANQHIASAVKTLNDSQLAGSNREFSIAIDPQSRRPVVQILDTDTHEVIDQIPSKYILDVAASLNAESASNIAANGR
jgi:uncharacterized FlaG/YvyC family protein